MKNRRRKPTDQAADPSRTGRKTGPAAEHPARRSAPPHNPFPPAIAESALCALALVALVAVAYSRVVNCDFLNLDDQMLVVKNDHVNTGLTWPNVVWAFSSIYGFNWVPLTWISHMVDCQLFGLAPWGHHLTNLLLHSVNTVLFFFFARRVTGSTWPSFLAASLFGLHPIHVESVAWVAERKDVLSTFFWLATCHAYLHYAPAPTVRRYLVLVLLYLAGLLAKPMLVTLPFVLLLLDVWPLRRLALVSNPKDLPQRGRPFEPIQTGSPLPTSRLMVEKMPLFALSAASCVITFLGQRSSGAVRPIDDYSIGLRLSNAAVSYIVYLGKLLVPARLPLFEPHEQQSLVSLQALLAILALLVCTGLTVALVQRRPYFATGWFWYLGTLVPVIGLVQVGGQGLAYRYTYVPLLGIYLVLAQGLADLMARRRLPARLVQGLVTGLACLLVTLTWRHTAHWRNNETIYNYTLKVTERNWLAHNNLGVFLMSNQRYEEAAVQFEQALRISPSYLFALQNLGITLQQLGRQADAITNYLRYLELKPDEPKVYDNLISALVHEKRYDQALRYANQLLGLDPRRVQSHVDQAMIYLDQKRFADAISPLKSAVALAPGNSTVLYYLGSAYRGAGSLHEALEVLERPLALEDAHQIKRFLLIAEARSDLKEYNKAAQDLREGLRRFPDRIELLEQLAYLEYSILDETTNAYQHLKRLLVLAPNHPQREEYQRAVDHLSQRLANTPVDPINQPPSKQ